MGVIIVEDLEFLAAAATTRNMNRALVSFRPILTRSGSVIALPALYRGYSRGPAAEEPVLELRFYTKNVCPLCDTAMEELEKVAEKVGFFLLWTSNSHGN